MDSLEDLCSPEQIDQRVAFHWRLEEEDAAAKELCARVLVGPSPWWGTRLRQEPGYRTAGVVRALLARYRDTLFHSPADALVLTSLAIEISGAIGVSDYPFGYVFTLRGQALRDQAFALSYQGRLSEAAEAAERAGRVLKQADVPHRELARLDLVRSNIARWREQYSEAIAFARRAGKMFLTFGDRDGWMKACDYEATTLIAQRDCAGALAVWRLVERHVLLLDEVRRGMLLLNLGICLYRTGESEEGIRYLRRALEKFERLNDRANSGKTRHCLGSALMAAGKYDEAIPLLRDTWHDLESLGMRCDADFTALLLVEGLIMTGGEGEAADICRTLIDRFTVAGMTSGAIAALNFLREALAAGLAKPEYVRQVHEFLRDTHVEKQYGSCPVG